ncbi:hypothetical protein PRZ48_009275 [Zasmidium cellare]|uniref:FAD-binding domain-containing protein n=1 Tax=Zasmidium cellare TaxID=395010 RepID=A0ABR0EC90_ZASCE|nr:hypothetical protein PRZ48_009275 [Zasmidium cellare]
MPRIPCPSTAEEAARNERPSDYKPPSEAPIRLKVAVVGAGVGGLATAVALRRDGHEVHVSEDAPALNELGAGIQVPPNSLTIMHKWGMEEAIKAKSVEPKHLWWKRWQDGKIIANTRYKPEFEENFGVPYRVIHRSHLHEALHDKAVELGVKIHLGHTVASYDPERPSMRFTNGREVFPDLLVAADGLKSTARQVITGERISLRNHGFAAYRACVPVVEMKKNPLIAKSMDFESLCLWVGDQTHVMSYPIKNGEDWNLVITVPEQREPCQWSDHSKQSLSIMRSFYEGWDPTLIDILKLVKTTFKWPVQDIAPLPTYTAPSKRMLILGDAAHAMLPSMAAGASIAIEDAQALAQALHLIHSRRQLPEAITTWESVRIPRATAMQEASYRHMYTLHLPDGPQKRTRDRLMEKEVNDEHFIASPNQWSDPTTQRWAYLCDPAAEVRDAWEKREAGRDEYVVAKGEEIYSMISARL